MDAEVHLRKLEHLYQVARSAAGTAFRSGSATGGPRSAFRSAPSSSTQPARCMAQFTSVRWTTPPSSRSTRASLTCSF